MASLLQALNAGDAQVRSSAASALATVRPSTLEIVIPALIRVSGDMDAGVRTAALTALGVMQGAAAPAVPALITALDDPDTGVRQAAIQSLQAVGPAAVPALVARPRPTAYRPISPPAVCRLSRSLTPTATSIAPAPTSTPPRPLLWEAGTVLTETESAPATPSPLAPTPTPAAAQVPGDVSVTISVQSGMNVRGGPGTDTPVVTGLPFNTTLPATARTADSTWVQADPAHGAGLGGPWPVWSR